MAIDICHIGDVNKRASNIEPTCGEIVRWDARLDRCVMEERIDKMERTETDMGYRWASQRPPHYSITPIPGQPLSSVFVMGGDCPLPCSCCCCCISPRPTFPWASCNTLWHSAPPSERRCRLRASRRLKVFLHP